MDKQSAALVLQSLLERIELDGSIGSASSIERVALKRAIGSLLGSDGQPSDSPGQVELDLTSLEVQTSEPGSWLCLDFGTALSKAFATTYDGRHVDLPLGVVAGIGGYGLPSSLLVDDDGRIYFGQSAIDRSLRHTGSPRERIDSIKGWISLQSKGSLDGTAAVLGREYNPTGVRLTQRDAIRLYLAYLTDVAGVALEMRKADGISLGRHARRRFARPCWKDGDQLAWADARMRKLLAEAQILADTFTGRWEQGLDLQVARQVLDKIDALPQLPEHLVEAGVPEPVAVAASAVDASENLREAFVVVDVGAGTTDFGVFISAHDRASGEQRVYQFPKSIRGVPQAGDRLDQILHSMIVRRESLGGGDVGTQLLVSELNRTIRDLKEVTFKTGTASYAFSNGIQGQVTVSELLAEEQVRTFSATIEAAFQDTVRSLPSDYIRWLAMPGVRLRVVLTGGGSRLPMVQSLAKAVVVVGTDRIQCELLDAMPEWIGDESDEFVAIYPQLAVAIGGSAGQLPVVIDAPLVFGGGAQNTYTAGKLHVGGK